MLITDPAERGPLTVVASPAGTRAGCSCTSPASTTATASEALRGTDLVVDVERAERPADPDEFYDHDLVGLRS